MKITLGTVQFGLPYGISNSIGQTQDADAQVILARAAAAGIEHLDTAPAYGDCEARLGHYGVSSFKIISKTPHFGKGPFSADTGTLLLEACHQSLRDLRIDSLYGLLIHNADDLNTIGGDHILESLQAAKAQGLTKKIGVSVYTAEQIDTVLTHFHPDLIQVPLNVFDQHLLTSGYLKRLHDMGVEIHARSLFLQGVVFMKTDELPPWLAPLRSRHEAFREFLCSTGLSPAQAAIAFGHAVPYVDQLVVGVNTVDHLEQIIAATATRLPLFDFAAFGLDSHHILNPANWPSL
jgi:aryl-alcohol dehydrogenase-like predicted oxidoreductase